MFLNFLGVNEKIVNFAAIAVIEDHSEPDLAKAIVTTTDGIELTFVGADAEAIFAHGEMLIAATNHLIAQMNAVAMPAADAP
ncbi:MAG: hypothetical protein KF736_09880 [Acidobacteria bacterium]|nr:hypothetical protein [Acidobacteriota bacterium]MCW5949834.1 hypothetical protein [Pyrinomonadaceae bacterium]